MSFRFMRIILFFDLPTEKPSDRRTYNKFRRNLIKDGFLMMQESVYVKLALNSTEVNTIKSRINKYKPKKGIVQILVITEKQFSGIEYIVGQKTINTVNDTERLVIL